MKVTDISDMACHLGLKAPTHHSEEWVIYWLQ